MEQLAGQGSMHEQDGCQGRHRVILSMAWPSKE